MTSRPKRSQAAVASYNDFGMEVSDAESSSDPEQGVDPDENPYVQKAEQFFTQPTGARRKAGDEKFIFTLGVEAYQNAFAEPAGARKSWEKSARVKLEKNYARWSLYLDEGFNLIFFGAGSKFELIEKFRVEYLCHCDQAVVRGFDPFCDLKALTEIVEQHFEVKISSDLEALAKLSRCQDRLTLIVHNLDCFLIRNKSASKFLISLIRNPSIRFVGTVDHVNSALLFTQAELSAMKILWTEASTGAKYWREISANQGANVLRSGEGVGIASHNLNSIRSTWASLTDNAKKIFRVLVEHTVQHKSDPMTLKELYRTCRENFLVNSEVALRTQLVEFKDHEFLTVSRTSAGSDMVNVLIPLVLLREFAREEGLITE